MGAPDRSHRPQYGWDRVTLLQGESLGEPGGVLPTTSTVVERPNGVYRVTVAGRCDVGDSSGTGQFGYALEGSNTGGVADAEWVNLGETNLAESYVAGLGTLQGRVLGFANDNVAGEGFNGEAQISVDRWKYLRIRTFVSFEDAGDLVTFEITFRMTAIGADGQATLTTDTLVRTSGDATEPDSEPIKKPAGVRFISAQAIVDAMILDPDPSDGFEILLQVAQTKVAVDNDQWIDFDILGPFIAAGEAGTFANGQTRLIDLGAFQFYRFKGRKITDGGASTDVSSYTIRCISTYDDADWIDGDQGIPKLHENLRKTFVVIVFDPVDVTAAPNVEIRMQICDMNQMPIRARRKVGLLLAATEDGFTDDLSPTGTFTSVSAPATLAYGAGNNVAVVETDVDGTATIQIDVNAEPNCFIAAWNQWVPNNPSLETFGPGQIVIATQRGDLVP